MVGGQLTVDTVRQQMGGGVSTIATGTGLLTDWLAHCKFIECGIEEGGGKLG